MYLMINYVICNKLYLFATIYLFLMKIMIKGAQNGKNQTKQITYESPPFGGLIREGRTRTVAYRPGDPNGQIPDPLGRTIRVA